MRRLAARIAAGRPRRTPTSDRALRCVERIIEQGTRRADAVAMWRETSPTCPTPLLQVRWWCAARQDRTVILDGQLAPVLWPRDVVLAAKGAHGRWRFDTRLASYVAARGGQLRGGGHLPREVALTFDAARRPRWHVYSEGIAVCAAQLRWHARGGLADPVGICHRLVVAQLTSAGERGLEVRKMIRWLSARYRRLRLY